MSGFIPRPSRPVNLIERKGVSFALACTTEGDLRLRGTWLWRMENWFIPLRSDERLRATTTCAQRQTRERCKGFHGIKINGLSGASE